jgi:hypothetical protein
VAKARRGGLEMSVFELGDEVVVLWFWGDRVWREARALA